MCMMLAMDSSPCEKCTPSIDVGIDGNVLNTVFASIPFSKGVYRLGSNVSVWAMPPAIHNRITVSALDFIAGLLQELSRLTGAPAANAASVAALVFCRNSRLFQPFIAKVYLIYAIRKSIETLEAGRPTRANPPLLTPKLFRQEVLCRRPSPAVSVVGQMPVDRSHRRVPCCRHR